MSDKKFYLGGPISKRAMDLYNQSIKDPNFELKIGTYTMMALYSPSFAKVPFMGIKHMIAFIEEFGDEFFYTEESGTPFSPIAVTTIKGNSVCTTHLYGKMAKVKKKGV